MQLTNAKSREFSKPVPQPDMRRCTNCINRNNLYVRFVVISIGSFTFRRKGNSPSWLVTSTSAKRIPTLYATMVNVWRVNIALMIRSANLALHVVSCMLTSLLAQSFQSSAIMVSSFINFLQIVRIIDLFSRKKLYSTCFNGSMNFVFAKINYTNVL